MSGHALRKITSGLSNTIIFRTRISRVKFVIVCVLNQSSRTSPIVQFQLPGLKMSHQEINIKFLQMSSFMPTSYEQNYISFYSLLNLLNNGTLIAIILLDSALIKYKRHENFQQDDTCVFSIMNRVLLSLKLPNHFCN